MDYTRYKMCRIIGIRTNNSEDQSHRIKLFADTCKNSQEYQGHGWGCAWKENGLWKEYHSINPIWEDNIPIINTRILLVHARSAFQNEGITIQNTMPFKSHDNKTVFIFNGELRGVRIRMEGRIGAEKIFNYIMSLSDKSIFEGMDKAIKIIEKRTKYIRAMNIIIGHDDNLYYCCYHNQDQAYYTLHKCSRHDITMVSSEPIDNNGWEIIRNKTMGEF